MYAKSLLVIYVITTTIITVLYIIIACSYKVLFPLLLLTSIQLVGDYLDGGSGAKICFQKVKLGISSKQPPFGTKQEVWLWVFKGIGRLNRSGWSASSWLLFLKSWLEWKEIVLQPSVTFALKSSHFLESMHTWWGKCFTYMFSSVNTSVYSRSN